MSLLLGKMRFWDDVSNNLKSIEFMLFDIDFATIKNCRIALIYNLLNILFDTIVYMSSQRDNLILSYITINIFCSNIRYSSYFYSRWQFTWASHKYSIKRRFKTNFVILLFFVLLSYYYLLSHVHITCLYVLNYRNKEILQFFFPQNCFYIIEQYVKKFTI